jgi:hypothetical protein
MHIFSASIISVQSLENVRPGHTALYGLITTKARQNVIYRKAGKMKSNN